MAILEVIGVTRSYESGRVVALDDISLTVGSGEFVSIVGPSGSGKSTLLNVLALLDRPTEGTYLINGADTGRLDELSRAQLRAATFGFVFQQHHLIERATALANVELGLVYQRVGPAERRRRAATALQQVGLGARTTHRARDLSGGERQRVAIARALISAPPVLVADEPTGSLDSVTARSILDLFVEIHAKGTTVVLVTHDQGIADAAQHRIRIRDGRVEDASQRVVAPPRMTAPVVGRRLTKLAGQDLLRSASEGLRLNRRRTQSLIAAVAAAVGLVIATLGLSQTAAAQVSDRFDARLNREVTVRVAQDPGLMSERSGSLPADAERRVRALAGVAAAGVLIDADQQALTTLPGRENHEVTLYGTSPGFLDAAEVDVRWAEGSHHLLGEREALLGRLTANQLGLAASDRDRVVFVNGTPFHVAGIITDGGRAPDLVSAVTTSDDDATGVGTMVAESMLLRTSPGAAPQVATQVALALDSRAPDRFEVVAPADPTSFRSEIEEDVQGLMTAFALLASLVAVAGIANSTSLGVVERTQEFGLRRALGARPRHIINQVLVETVLAGTAGGLAGLYIGMAGVLAVTVASGWQPVLDLRAVPVAVALGAAVGAVGGLLPARRASRIEPIDALRR